jgi:hypothetical protein
MNPAIKRYLEDHGSTYTPEALRKGLLDAGYDPGEVEAALAAFASGRAPAAAERRPAHAYVWSVFWIGSVGVLALIGLLFSINRNPDKVLLIGLFAAILLGAYLVLGYLVAKWMSRRMVPTSAIGWVGAIVLAPLVFFLIAYGACAASSILVGPV